MCGAARGREVELEHDNRCDVFAAGRLARSSFQAESPLSVAPSRSHPGAPVSARRAAVLLPSGAVLTCTRYVRRSTKVFMEISLE